MTSKSPSPPASVQKQQPCKHPRVQIVSRDEDCEFVECKECGEIFESSEFTVESATNGVEALQILTHLQPDLIVTDMQMPKMSGPELITVLKSKPETAKISIIIVASRGSGFDESEKRANFAIYKDIDIE